MPIQKPQHNKAVQMTQPTQEQAQQNVDTLTQGTQMSHFTTDKIVFPTESQNHSVEIQDDPRFGRYMIAQDDEILKRSFNPRNSVLRANFEHSCISWYKEILKAHDPNGIFSFHTGNYRKCLGVLSLNAEKLPPQFAKLNTTIVQVGVFTDSNDDDLEETHTHWFSKSMRDDRIIAQLLKEYFGRQSKTKVSYSLREIEAELKDALRFLKGHLPLYITLQILDVPLIKVRKNSGNVWAMFDKSTGSYLTENPYTLTDPSDDDLVETNAHWFSKMQHGDQEFAEFEKQIIKLVKAFQNTHDFLDILAEDWSIPKGNSSLNEKIYEFLESNHPEDDDGFKKIMGNLFCKVEDFDVLDLNKWLPVHIQAYRIDKKAEPYYIFE